MTKLERWLVGGGILLLANSTYLQLGGDPDLFYFANVLAHLIGGLALALGFFVWWRRGTRTRGVRVAGWILLAGVGVGAAVAAIGNRYGTRPILWVHIALMCAGILVLLWAFAEFKRTRIWKRSVLIVAICVVGSPLILLFRAEHPPADAAIHNAPAPTSMAGEAMGGKDGPFFPSSAHTANKALVPSSIYLKPQSCARSGCHPDIYKEWKSSAHHFSSFNNQWYRKAVVYMQQVTGGPQASQWCGGCHDPAVLLSGMMRTPIQKIMYRSESQAGLTCTACHMISSVHSTMGNGDYTIKIPALHGLATSDNPLLQVGHDFLVRLEPRPHRRTFLRPFFRDSDAPKFCSACHKVHLDTGVNHYRWVRGFDEYDHWQASGVSGYGARSFYYPAKPHNCIHCHMPLVRSNDGGNQNGFIHSHRFAAANTALPTANEDPVQLAAVEAFLKDRQVTVDIFAMSQASSEHEATRRALTSAGQIETQFAVGEEQGMRVGSGPAAGPETEKIYAPLNRIPATVYRGESTRVDVVVRTRGVGHFFPGGTVDAYDCWLELKAVDNNGRTIFWSGKAGPNSPVDPSAHFYKSLSIDAHGNPIDKRNAYAARATVYVHLIPPGAADTVHYRLIVPKDVGRRIELTAKLNYRKFSWEYTRFAYAGVPDTSQKNATYTPDYDDRHFVYTGNTSHVAGKIKKIPTLPIVVMAEAHASLAVVDSTAQLPDMTHPKLQASDRERFNDYGIGLLLQGDLRGAKRAFTEVTKIQPSYPDGWVNLGRVAVTEGDLQEARRVLDQAVLLSPHLGRAEYFLGLVDKEQGRYDEALGLLEEVRRQYPQDRVVLNQIGRIQFLQHHWRKAVTTVQGVLQIDPEDLMAHYTLMLAYRGLGDTKDAELHQRLYERFKANEPSQILTGEYRKTHPYDNNERQSIHEHDSIPLPINEARTDRPRQRGAMSGKGRHR